MGEDRTVRQAREDDYDAVAAFTGDDTWADRAVGDYLPEVLHEWVETDGPTQRTFVLDAGDELAGICQGVLLTDHEAWAQGMRVNPDYRGRGVSSELTYAVFDWARERGATVCRNLVFSWNTGGLGQSRATGFQPLAEFRWAYPEPDADAGPDADGDSGQDTALTVVEDADAAWSYWARSEARDALAGLALDLDETWAVAELTRERLHRVADGEGRVFAVQDPAEGTRAMGVRVREFERSAEEIDADDDEHWAEYGVGAWADVRSARALFGAIAADAAALGADRTRVLIPETPRHVTDIAYARVPIGDEPDFVLEADLTARDG